MNSNPDELPPAPRLDFGWAAPQGVRALQELERYVTSTGVDPGLRDLVRIRCSQINGCAYCVQMHVKEALERGEQNLRLHAVAVWRESRHFTPKERAALAWAEAVTLVSADHVPDEVYSWVAKHFEGKELVDLTMAVIAINGWNRLAVSFRSVPDGD